MSLDRKVSAEGDDAGPACLALANSRQDVWQLGREIIEDRIDGSGGETGILLIHHRIVGRETQRGSFGRSDLPVDRHEFLEPRCECSEVAIRLGVDPRHLQRLADARPLNQ